MSMPNEETQRRADVIRRQIGSNTLLCIGAREFIADNPDHAIVSLRFRITISSNVRHYVSISLDYGDTYTVELGRWSNKLGMVREMHATDVYCDQLAELVYRMGTPKFQDMAWFDAVGITLEKAGRKYLRKNAA